MPRQTLLCLSRLFSLRPPSDQAGSVDASERFRLAEAQETVGSGRSCNGHGGGEVLSLAKS